MLITIGQLLTILIAVGHIIFTGSSESKSTLGSMIQITLNVESFVTIFNKYVDEYNCF